jgi:hypothetical protein
MTKFVGTPLRGFGFNTVASEALSARVSSDSVPRIRIDAGGKITWGSGSTAGDTNLYRSDANTLTTDDVFVATGGMVTLTTNGAPNASLPNGALAVDTTNHVFYYRSNSTWTQVTGGGGGGGGGGANVTISSTAPVSPENGDLWYNNVGNLLYIYDSGSWDTVSGTVALPDLDGGDILLPELYEAEVTNGVIAVFDGGIAA